MMKLSNVPVRILINPPSLIWFIKYISCFSRHDQLMNGDLHCNVYGNYYYYTGKVMQWQSFVFNAVTNGLWVLVFYFPVVSYFSRLMIWFLINLNGFPDTHINWGFRWIGEEISPAAAYFINQSINDSPRDNHLRQSYIIIIRRKKRIEAVN